MRNLNQELSTQLNAKASAIQVQPGQLLALAREVAANPELVSVEQLTPMETGELIILLDKISHQESQRAAAREVHELVGAV